jgi:hypothetical protein
MGIMSRVTKGPPQIRDGRKGLDRSYTSKNVHIGELSQQMECWVDG